jgi:hypothetical protein
MRKASLRVSSLAVCAVGVAALSAGCSSEGSQPPSDFCKSVASLDAAVTQINQTYLSKQTVSAVKSSMAALGTRVKNLSQTAGSEFQDEVNAVEAASTSLDKTVAAAVDRPVPANMNAARTSMRDFTSAVNHLAESTSESC